MGAAVVGAIGTFLTSQAVVVVLIRTILINVLIGAITRSLQRDPDRFAPPINVTVRNTIENRRLIFGRQRTGGTIVFYRASGDRNQFLHYVIAVAGHQVSAITDVWLDKQPITNAQIDAGTGAVTGGYFTGKLWIFKHLGTSAQTVDTVLSAARLDWDSTHRLQGIAYIHVKMERDDEKYIQGAPQDVSCVVEGALLYDPRLDSTNGGSGSHRRTDPSTWAFSRNSALIARWFISGGAVVNDQSTRMIRYGLREDDARIVDSYTITAANKCEEQLTGAYSTPDGDQQRYTCDLEVSTGEERRDILDSILATMAGHAIYVHGKWRIYAGAYDAPVHTISEADLFGDTPIEVDDGASRPERYNAVAAVFRDAAASYEEQTTPFRTNSTFEAADGDERIPREINLRGVTDKYRAQRLCEIELQKSRMMRAVKLRGSLNLLKVAPHETLSFSHARLAWTGREFRTIEREFEFNEDAGVVAITGQQESAAVYADILTANYITPNTVIPVQQVDSPNPPTSLSTVGQQGSILVKWGRSSTPSVNYQLEQSTSSSMSSAVVVYDGPDSQALIEQTGTTIFYFRVRAYKNGQYSSYVPTTGGTSGAASGVSTALAVTVSSGSASSSSTASSQTTPSVTVTASAGTPAYSYAWTWLSGGSGITINSASAATTSFTATALGNPETRSGVARCTVTDAASGSKTVDVSVSIQRIASFAASAAGTSPLSKSANNNTITSNPITCTASGGTAPYTYAWSIVTHNDPNSTPTINNSTSQTCTVTTNDSPVAQRDISVTVRCVITDNVGATATSNNVTITHTHDNGA